MSAEPECVGCSWCGDLHEAHLYARINRHTWLCAACWWQGKGGKR